ncbi:MAG: hypothetical protein H6568_14085 [Lewinellaceae bacterium]|nr:hypothetical protein [Saprospiraceae bacterium]MCB9313885.1 hypothetical protein [Lewinellaceae bacterium]HRW76568.1 hypothetical protein [Saprospiraceae bacterium]
MSEWIQYFLPVLALTAVCAGWIGVQLLARRMGTKHHLGERKAGSCGGCGCQGQCELPKE